MHVLCIYPCLYEADRTPSFQAWLVNINDSDVSMVIFSDKA
jgi:hypothetical protein